MDALFESCCSGSPEIAEQASSITLGLFEGSLAHQFSEALRCQRQASHHQN